MKGKEANMPDYAPGKPKDYDCEPDLLKANPLPKEGQQPPAEVKQPPTDDKKRYDDCSDNG